MTDYMILMGVKPLPRKTVVGVIVTKKEDDPAPWLRTKMQSDIWDFLKISPATIGEIVEELKIKRPTVLRTLKPWLDKGVLRKIEIEESKEALYECSEHLE